MLQIALLDDKSYGLKQIQDRHIGEEFELSYFENFQKFQEDGRIFDIVYLDYYLEKDGCTGADILEKVRKQAEKVIGFSSLMRRSEELKNLGADDALLKSS